MSTALLAMILVVMAGSNETEIERPIALEDVPLAARSVIVAEAGDHAILEIEEVTLNEGTFYEAEWIADGMEVEILVTPKGKIVARDIEEPDDEDDESEDESRDD